MFVELEDRRSESAKRLLVDLEQLVARILLEHVCQRLAGMAVRIEAEPLLDRGELLAQIRNAARRARIGGRGEQADDAHLADQPAHGIEALDADVVEIDPPVYQRAHIGLRHDQRLRLLEEGHDLRRELEQLVAAPEHPHVRRAQHAERGILLGLQAARCEHVIADADEGEIVGPQPIEKLDRLGYFVDRQRRRILLEVGDDLRDAAEHRPPVLQPRAAPARARCARRHDFIAARGVVDRRKMNVDEAFTLACRSRSGEASVSLIGCIALDRKHRMHDDARPQATVIELGEHRVDQERHVVIDDLDEPDRPRGRPMTEAWRPRNESSARRLCVRQETRTRRRRAAPDRRRRRATQIFRHCTRIKLSEKAARRARIKGRENFFRPRDQGARRGIVLAAGRRGRGGFPRAENWVGRIHVFARIPQCRPNQRQSAHKHMTMADA